MDLVTLSLFAIILCFGLFALFLGSRLFGPVIRGFVALSGEEDSLQNRIFPILGYIGLLCIFIKITLF